MNQSDRGRKRREIQNYKAKLTIMSEKNQLYTDSQVRSRTADKC